MTISEKVIPRTSATTATDFCPVVNQPNNKFFNVDFIVVFEPQTGMWPSGDRFRITGESQLNESQGAIRQSIDEVKRLHDLEIGWDGYAAPSPSDSAILNAIEFLIQSDLILTRPTRIAPSAAGGVGITYEGNVNNAYLEFYNNGSLFVLIFGDVGGPSVTPHRTERSSLKKLAEELSDSLDSRHS